MRKITSIAVILLIVTSLISCIQSDAKVGQLPYWVFGTVSEEDGDPVSGATVVLTMQRTGDTLTTTTNATGKYVLDLANLDNEYIEGDELNVTIEGASGGLTFIVDTVNNEEGILADITLSSELDVYPDTADDEDRYTPLSSIVSEHYIASLLIMITIVVTFILYMKVLKKRSGKGV